MASHNDLGTWGEQEATDFLLQKGYTILERDWKSGHRDIDIIAQKGDVRGVIDEETIADGVLDKYIMTIDSKTKPRAFHLADFMKENFGENSVKKVNCLYGIYSSQPPLSLISL